MKESIALLRSASASASSAVACAFGGGGGSSGGGCGGGGGGGGHAADKVLVCLFAAGEEGRVRHAEHLDDAAELVVLGLAREEGQAEEELAHDAAERPGVDLAAIRMAEQDLGRAVEARLDVGGGGHLLLVAGGAEVDDLDGGRLQVPQQDVLL